MATKYTTSLNQTDLTIIRSGIALLVQVLTPYRNDVVISRKVLFFSVNLTVGDVLDFLVKQFAK